MSWLKTYVRPLAILYGPDARRAIEQGRAGRLGGSSFIAFAEVEVIERGPGATRRECVAYRDVRDQLANIEASRPPVCGWALDRPILMGVVNVTPDSFSDGGLLVDAAAAIDAGIRLAAEGAAILDIGGESTRPGSEGVSEEEELRRVLPVVRGLSAAGHVVSVDTRKAVLMEEAAGAGARLINDVSAFGFDPASLGTAARLGLPVVLMHAQGDPKTMQINPTYDDVALDVYDWLEARITACLAAGIARERIIVDPGIGFGKTHRHNFELLQQLALFQGLGVPLLLGMSRKSFIGALTGEPVAARRIMGSVGGAIHGGLHGTQILRVHDVHATKQSLTVALAAAGLEDHQT